MKKYILMHKNKAILGFVVNNSDVENVTMSKRFLEFIPLPIKRAIRLNGYIESENSNIIILNEEGSFLLDTWLHDRAIPYNRDNMAKYIPSGIGNFNYMLNNFSVSLTDCYWTIELSEKNKGVNWDSIKYYNNKRIDRLDIIEQSRNKGTIYSGVNSTLGGMLEKYWFYTIKDNKKQLMLAKRTDLNNSILNIREVIASKIYELQGFKNYCQYKYIRNNSKQIVGVKCKAFTSENIELITVYDLLDEFNETQHSDVYSNIIKRASAYGADPCKVANQLDIQTLVDYLITNRDRHQNNIGFLRNPETLKIIDIAPIFDSGSSKYLEGEKPESVLNTYVHNLYNTEIDCLSNVKNIRALDLTKLPSNQWILNELRKAENLSEYRIQFMYQLYKDKVKYLKELQDKAK